MNWQVRLAAAVLWCASAASAVDWTILKPQGYASDFAGVVDASAKRELDAYCAAVEQATGARIALVTIGSLQREPIEDVTRAIFRAWDLDKTPHGNAVIWLVAVENRRDAVKVGSGLASVLTESEIAAILAQARPALARQQYAEALMAVADETGSRIARAQHKTIAARLPRRAHRGLAESLPWMLASGALLLCFWLFRVLGPPARHIRVPAGFGVDEKGGW